MGRSVRISLALAASTAFGGLFPSTVWAEQPYNPAAFASPYEDWVERVHKEVGLPPIRNYHFDAIRLTRLDYRSPEGVIYEIALNPPETQGMATVVRTRVLRGEEDYTVTELTVATVSIPMFFNVVERTLAVLMPPGQSVNNEGEEYVICTGDCSLISVDAKLESGYAQHLSRRANASSYNKYVYATDKAFGRWIDELLAPKQ